MSNDGTARRGLIRQGDVLLVPVAELPQRGRGEPVLSPSLVLAEGEATGHAHRLETQQPAAFHRLWDLREFVVVPDGAGARLVHQEHEPLVVAAGAWEVRRQREYDPSRAWRAVRD